MYQFYGRKRKYAGGSLGDPARRGLFPRLTGGLRVRDRRTTVRRLVIGAPGAADSAAPAPHLASSVSRSEGTRVRP